MKKFIVFIITAIILAVSTISCKDKTDYKQVVNDEYSMATDNAKTIKSDDFPFFLGFKMGMTEKEVKGHADSLVTAKKLTKQSGKYIYSFGKNSRPYSLNFDYANGELYELYLRCEVSPTFAESFALVDGTELREILTENSGYKTYYYRIELDSYNETLVSTLKGNVEFKQFFMGLYFTDLYRERSKEENLKGNMLSDINM